MLRGNAADRIRGPNHEPKQSKPASEGPNRRSPPYSVGFGIWCFYFLRTSGFGLRTSGQSTFFGLWTISSTRQTWESGSAGTWRPYVPPCADPTPRSTVRRRLHPRPLARRRLHRPRRDARRRGCVPCRNLLTRPPPDEDGLPLVIIGAHYDSVPGSPGPTTTPAPWPPCWSWPRGSARAGRRRPVARPAATASPTTWKNTACVGSDLHSGDLEQGDGPRCAA